MKRTLDDAFDSEDQLREFKNTLRLKSHIILEKELDKLVSRSLNQENMAKYIKRQN